MYDTEFYIEYRGKFWNYGMYREFEDDNVKMFHFAWEEGTKPQHLSFSPYVCVTYDSLWLWVASGCPSYEDNGNRNFTNESIVEYAKQRGITA